MFHEITISNEQLDVLKKLSQINKITGNFYLAGGTALSLRLGHRKSYDFDFFTFGNFDSESFSDLIKLDFDLHFRLLRKNLLTLRLEREHQVKFESIL